MRDRISEKKFFHALSEISFHCMRCKPSGSLPKAGTRVRTGADCAPARGPRPSPAPPGGGNCSASIARAVGAGSGEDVVPTPALPPTAHVDQPSMCRGIRGGGREMLRRSRRREHSQTRTRTSSRTARRPRGAARGDEATALTPVKGKRARRAKQRSNVLQRSWRRPMPLQPRRGRGAAVVEVKSAPACWMAEGLAQTLTASIYVARGSFLAGSV